MTLILLPAVFHLKLQKLYIFAKFGEKVGEAKAAHETSFGKEEIFQNSQKGCAQVLFLDLQRKYCFE